MSFLKDSFKYVHPHDFKSWCWFLWRLPGAWWKYNIVFNYKIERRIWKSLCSAGIHCMRPKTATESKDKRMNHWNTTCKYCGHSEWR